MTHRPRQFVACWAAIVMAGARAFAQTEEARIGSHAAHPDAVPSAVVPCARLYPNSVSAAVKPGDRVRVSASGHRLEGTFVDCHGDTLVLDLRGAEAAARLALDDSLFVQRISHKRAAIGLGVAGAALGVYSGYHHTKHGGISLAAEPRTLPTPSGRDYAVNMTFGAATGALLGVGIGFLDALATRWWDLVDGAREP